MHVIATHRSAGGSFCVMSGNSQPGMGAVSLYHMTDPSILSITGPNLPLPIAIAQVTLSQCKSPWDFVSAFTNHYTKFLPVMFWDVFIWLSSWPGNHFEPLICFICGS